MPPQAVHAADRLPEEWGDLFVRESLDTVGVGELAAGLCTAALGRV